MWALITNCGKQLTINSKVRENSDGHLAVYKIVEVESDQFKLKLIEKNNSPVSEEVGPVLSCIQMLQYAFEVEQKG
ncbi:MAG: hypothetical protein ABI237_17445 [Ginsengibacter sp.]